MNMRVAVLDDYLKVAEGLANWKVLDAQLEFFDHYIEPRDLVATLKDFDVIVAMRERSAFPAAALEGLTSLKLLMTTGLRNNSIDLEACRNKGVVVCGAPGDPQSTGATTELAWALLLGLFKRVPHEYINMQQGKWQTQMPATVCGKRLGLLGVGNLGQRMGKVGLAFGMDVVAWSPNLTEERAKEAGVRMVSKQELFETSDAVSVHLVLSARTKGIVDAQAISLMKPSAYLINTSRAGLVDLVALKNALELGKIGGAGLDVFETEPLPADDPWRSVPRTLLTPHLGYATPENFAVFYPNVLAGIQAWLAGNPIRVLA
jgi:phosphoglycerate dehydrogenase-like enzyme